MGDSGSGESWFDPRRGNCKRDERLPLVALPVSGLFARRCLSRKVCNDSFLGPDSNKLQQRFEFFSVCGPKGSYVCIARRGAIFV
jgi:hypothetical protein